MKWAVIAFELAALAGAGFLAGSFLDQVWEKQGAFQVGGIVLAFLLWVFIVWKRLQS